uniref:G-protein coupled receptors family 1 profile domain-containing protein n=1 Tax=Octopus bimaculoides TaxID=37653 RepID=A0A0L8FSJ7_OCTBM
MHLFWISAIFDSFWCQLLPTFDNFLCSLYVYRCHFYQ